MKIQMTRGCIAGSLTIDGKEEIHLTDDERQEVLRHIFEFFTRGLDLDSLDMIERDWNKYDFNQYDDIFAHAFDALTILSGTQHVVQLNEQQ